MKIVVASSSPRRAQILRDAGIPFEAVPTGVEEARSPDESPENLVRRLAEVKAGAAARIFAMGDEPVFFVGADTVVVIDDLILGKPASPEEAREMLQRLSGRTHTVLTGLTVLRRPPGMSRTEIESTRVSFAALSEQQIAAYVASGEPFGKAGAYAIQGRAGRFVTRVEGCYFNVVGLPLARLDRLLGELGWQGS